MRGVRPSLARRPVVPLLTRSGLVRWRVVQRVNGDYQPLCTGTMVRDGPKGIARSSASGPIGPTRWPLDPRATGHRARLSFVRPCTTTIRAGGERRQSRTGGSLPTMAVIMETGERVAANVERVIVGKHLEVRLALVALLCQGHLLIEDVPGHRQDDAGAGAGEEPRRARSDASSSRPTCCPATSPGSRSSTRRPRSSSSDRAPS